MEYGDKLTIQSGWTSDKEDAEPTQHYSQRELAGHLLDQAANQGHQVYAILDAAHGDLVLEQLATVCTEEDGQDSDYELLGPGRSDDELFTTSAFLVPCQSGSDLLRWLCTKGFGQSFGVLLASKASPTELAAHLHPLTEVKDEKKRTLLFRFYDPRVLRVYLPTCTPWELRRFFGPVERFWTENPEGAGLLDFTQPAVDGEIEEDVGEDELLAGQTIISKDRPNLVMREAQLLVFKGEAESGFQQRVADHLRHHFPDDCAELGAEGLQEVIQHGMDRATLHGLQVERDVCLFLGLMFLFGPELDEDPEVPWVGRILRDERLDTPKKRIDALWAEAEKQLLKSRARTALGGMA